MLSRYQDAKVELENLKNFFRLVKELGMGFLDDTETSLVTKMCVPVN